MLFARTAGSTATAEAAVGSAIWVEGELESDARVQEGGERGTQSMFKVGCMYV